MIGAIAGDVIGSVYEWNNIKTKRFELFSPSCSFTDDSVLTVALADAILTNRDYVSVMKSYYLRYPDAGMVVFSINGHALRTARPIIAGAMELPCGSARSDLPSILWRKSWPKRRSI